MSLRKEKIKVIERVEVDGECPNCGCKHWYIGWSTSHGAEVQCTNCNLWFLNSPDGLKFIYQNQLTDEVERENTKHIRWGYCPLCDERFGWEFFWHANGKEFPRCHKHGIFLMDCWTAKQYSPYICDNCTDKYSCYTE